MEESILNSIKKLLGIAANYTHFDTDIIIHINTVFMTLNQLGVGPSEGFRIKDSITQWNEYIEDDDDLDGVKTYMYLRVKLIFDPPLNGSIQATMKESIREFEWRLNIQAESEE